MQNLVLQHFLFDCIDVSVPTKSYQSGKLCSLAASLTVILRLLPSFNLPMHISSSSAKFLQVKVLAGLSKYKSLGFTHFEAFHI